MSPALSRSSRQRCGQNMRWNNLRFLHKAATYLLQLDFKLLTSWLFRNGGCRSDSHFMGTLHIVTTPSEWQLATNTSVWHRSVASSWKDHVHPWLTSPRSSPPRPKDILLYYLFGLEFYELYMGGYQSDLEPPWVSVWCCTAWDFIIAVSCWDS